MKITSGYDIPDNNLTPEDFTEVEEVKICHVCFNEIAPGYEKCVIFPAKGNKKEQYLYLCHDCVDEFVKEFDLTIID